MSCGFFLYNILRFLKSFLPCIFLFHFLNKLYKKKPQNHEIDYFVSLKLSGVVFMSCGFCGFMVFIYTTFSFFKSFFTLYFFVSLFVKVV